MSLHPNPKPSSSVDSAHDLTFTHAEPVGGGEAGATGAACVVCKAPITGSYYTANGQVVCPGCRDGFTAARTGGSGVARVFKAAAFGVVAAMIGGGVWYGVSRVTGYEIGLIAVVVGLMVGGAVRAGSGGRGGWVYQSLAVILTYLAIAARYMPELVAGFRASDDPQIASAPLVAHLIVGAIASLAAPVLIAKESIIMVAIYLFALYEAWKLNHGVSVSFEGPFTMAAPAPSTPTPPAA